MGAPRCEAVADSAVDVIGSPAATDAMAATTASREAGLRQMGCKARLAAPADVLLLPVAAQRNTGECVTSLTQLAHQVVTAAVRQPEIADEKIETILAASSNAVATSPAVSTV